MFVETVGFEPTSPDFQSGALTIFAIFPFVGKAGFDPANSSFQSQRGRPDSSTSRYVTFVGAVRIELTTSCTAKVQRTFERADAMVGRAENVLIFEITADRFLRNMVRAIVGTLLKAGINKIDEKDFLNILLSRNRSIAGKSVPAHGLYLTDIAYPFRVL